MRIGAVLHKLYRCASAVTAADDAKARMAIETNLPTLLVISVLEKRLTTTEARRHGAQSTTTKTLQRSVQKEDI